MIDAHIHLYDPRRPGTPYPTPERKRIYRPMLPADAAETARPVGIRGVVAIECSPRLEDTAWLLQIAEAEPFINAVIGNLDAESAAFPELLARFAPHPLFRGIRQRQPGRAIDFRHPRLRPNLERLADARCVLELPLSVAELPATAALARELPGLRLMIDHLASVRIAGASVDPEWQRALEPFADLPQVSCKLSHFTESTVRKPFPLDVDYYAPTFAAAWQAFGPDRLVFGSNWPPCLEAGDYCATVTLARDFLRRQGGGAEDRVMRANAAAFYGGARFRA